ncbi:DUF3037 domain-containing protein [Caenimonas terrae]|uniref:DUF3037 domain-containing protein n=1 Tax=Caenimonas terrae TaxID=696074 RepID=A0ABW0NBD4_9BURK
MTIACHYAIVRFVPFVETGEFANVGVVLLSPSARFFGFRLMKARYARITSFFEELDGKVFRTVMRQAHEEFQRVASEFKPLGTDRRFKSFDKVGAFALWTELTKPLSSILRMGEPRLVMADDPVAKLEGLFKYYVERNFVTREYQEALMERTVRGVLKGLGVADRYQHLRVGNDEYNAAFPFVATALDETPLQIIKPLNLGHTEPTKVLDHGAAWTHKMATLRKKGFLPESVLVTVAGDANEDSKLGEARRDVIGDFNALDVTVASIQDKLAVQSFASSLTPLIDLKSDAPLKRYERPVLEHEELLKLLALPHRPKR